MNNQIVILLLPIIAASVFIILTVIIFFFVYPDRPKSPELVSRKHKSFLNDFLREYAYWSLIPLLYFFKKLRVTPNTLTCISLVFASISAYLFYKGSFAPGGWLLFLSGVLDMIDGRLARTTGRVTKEGAFLDSCVDRYSDGVIFLGIALYFRNDTLMLFATILALIGSEVVSYSKAKGECNNINTNVGLMQRPERVFLICFVSIFYPFFTVILSNYNLNTDYPMMIIIFLMAVSTNYTAFVRISTIFGEIRKKL